MREKRFSKTLKKVAALMLALALILSACGTQKEEESGKRPSQASESAQTEDKKGEEGKDTKQASQPLRIGVAFNPEDTLDPVTVTSPGGMLLLYAVYDSLATTQTDGVTLRLAKSIEANEDCSVYTVTLKDGVTFSDGSPMTGEDVLLSVKHLSKSQEYQTILVNLDVEKSKAEGPVVTLALKEPAADFVESSIGMFLPVAKGGVFEGIGAGAYTLAKGDAQTGYLLKANEHYYAGKPAIPEVTLKNVPDSGAKVKALQTGEIDYAWGLDGSSVQVLSQEAGIELPKGSLDGALALELVLNTRVAPFNDPEVRKAAKLTVDREKMVKTILGDYGEVGNDMLGKGFAGYPADLEQTTMNKEEAKRIFAEKGVTSFTIVSSDTVPGINKATEMMVQDFQDVGVSVTVEELDPQTFFAQMGDLYGKSAFTFYWLNRAPIAEFRLELLKESPYNVSGYFSDTIAKNFKQVTSTKDEKAQKEAIEALSKEIHKEGGELIWGFQMDISARRKGFTAPLTQSVPWLAEATFVPEGK